MQDHKFKVILLGDGRVGKTSILLRYIHDNFDEKQRSTFQASYQEKILNIGNRCVSLYIWDTAGQERFHCLAPIYYRDANAAIIVFDITNPTSFHKMQKWVDELHKVVGKNNIVIFIAANKSDLQRKEQVNNDDVQTYAESIGAQWIATSAKTAKGIQELFLELTKKMIIAESRVVNRIRRSRGPKCKIAVMDSGDFSSSKSKTPWYKSFSSSKPNTIGLSVSGAKDVNNFRKCVENNTMPSIDSITYNGLLYEYYFDTATTQRSKVCDNEVEGENKYDDGSMLFYPSYCYAKVNKLDFMQINKGNNEKDRYEYYMSVGLNSNIDQDKFKRKRLNLFIILDKSGSMSSRFSNDRSINKSKMEIANEACVTLLNHLTAEDRFGFIQFDADVAILQGLQYVKDINMNEVKDTILNIKAGGQNEFCLAYKAAIKYYDELFAEKNYDGNEYDNRIIFLTDAQIHIGCSDPNLLKYVKNDAENRKENRIYTTFIGVGLDLYATLCEQICSTRGCNYYSVKSSKDFMCRMDEQFEFMVTPLVFNVVLKLNCEGNSCKIEKVYGSSQDEENNIIQNGEISKINTLFPSKRACDGGIAGGIQLIKLKKCNDDIININVELIVTFEDRNGKKYVNKQCVTFETPYLINREGINNCNMDMIEQDDDEEKIEDLKINFYDNIGIRKAILLCQYVELMINWIKSVNYKLGNGSELQINEEYKNMFREFLKHFKKEMKFCNDKSLDKEIKIMEKLIKIRSNTGALQPNQNASFWDWCVLL